MADMMTLRNAFVVRDSMRALLLSVETKSRLSNEIRRIQIWFPKSQISHEKAGVIKASRWILERNEQQNQVFQICTIEDPFDD